MVPVLERHALHGQPVRGIWLFGTGIAGIMPVGDGFMDRGMAGTERRGGRARKWSGICPASPASGGRRKLVPKAYTGNGLGAYRHPDFGGIGLSCGHVWGEGIV